MMTSIPTMNPIAANNNFIAINQANPSKLNVKMSLGNLIENDAMCMNISDMNVSVKIQ